VGYAYTKGVHPVGDGCYAYLQPDGSWGWSNAGLIVDGEATLLVDTLYDLRLTAEMLDAFRDVYPPAGRIGTLVNTHANGDHCYGNQLVEGAEIIATRAAAEEMPKFAPDKMARLMRLTRALSRLPRPFGALPVGPGMIGLRDLGLYFSRNFASFTFDDMRLTLPSRTFEGELSLRVGDRDVHLIEVGPAHTRGDLLVHVPSSRTIFTGDILFSNGHPIVWDGPIANWERACERIVALAPEVIVPGHGPIVGLEAVRRLQDYFRHVRREARRRFDAGVGVMDAALDIPMQPFDDWGDAERLVVNVAQFYREFQGRTSPYSITSLFIKMATFHQRISRASGG